MKNKTSFFLITLALFLTSSFTNCATTQNKNFSQYNFTLNNTLSIFLLSNEKGYYFCIPVQYIGDFQINRFDFIHGNVQIGGYDISLKRDNVNIYVYLNETADENGIAVGDYNLIYMEENGRELISKIADPLGIKNDPEYMMNKYDIFIERYLTENEMKNIIDEYDRKNTASNMSIWFDLTIDNEEQNGSGMLDVFELHSGSVNEYVWVFPHFEFFRDKYLVK